MSTLGGGNPGTTSLAGCGEGCFLGASWEAILHSLCWQSWAVAFLRRPLQALPGGGFWPPTLDAYCFGVWTCLLLDLSAELPIYLSHKQNPSMFLMSSFKYILHFALLWTLYFESQINSLGASSSIGQQKVNIHSKEFTGLSGHQIACFLAISLRPIKKLLDRRAYLVRFLTEESLRRQFLSILKKRIEETYIWDIPWTLILAFILMQL